MRLAGKCCGFSLLLHSTTAGKPIASNILMADQENSVPQSDIDG